MKQVNEHRAELASSASFNPFIAHDSSARVQMMGSHLSQALPVKDCQPRRILTGMEREFGRATFNVEIPVDAEIIDIIHKFTDTAGAGGIRINPTTVIIYMDARTNQFDAVEFNSYHSMHQSFGFNFVRTQAMRNLRPEQSIPAGTVLGRSPTLDDQDNYRIGLNVKSAFMSIPGVTEDGFIVSESLCKRMTTTCIKKTSFSWGKTWYPLNLYGDEKNYKPMPDIGDRIRDDGLICTLRRMDQDTDIMYYPLEMSNEALQRVDYFFDQRVYGKKGAKVINITSRHGQRAWPRTPDGMEAQAKKYYDAECEFHQAILDSHRKLARRYGDRVALGGTFSMLLREARLFLPCEQRAKSTQMYQLQPLDDWRIDLTYEYDFVPTIGSKLTGLHGDKGVICQIWPDEDMPVDEWGNRVEAISPAYSSIDRMNDGRPIEHEINGSMEMMTEAVRMGMGAPLKFIDPATHQAMLEVRAERERRGLPVPDGQVAAEQIAARINGDYNNAFHEVKEYYKTMSPKFGAIFDRPDYLNAGGGAKYHIDDLLKDGMYLWAPLDTPKIWPDVIDDIDPDTKARMIAESIVASDQTLGMVVGDKQLYPARRSILRFRGRSGKIRFTEEPIMVADLYHILLEKTGSDWSGVSTAYHQHFGLPAKQSKQDRDSSPGRANPVRIFGEAEVRLTSAVLDSKIVAETMEMSTNPAVHKNVVYNILKAPQPSNIEEVVDRSKVPIGNSRSQSFVAHGLQCAGIELRYVDHTTEGEVYPADPGGAASDLGLLTGDEEDDDDDVNENEDGDDSADDGDDSDD